MHRRCVRGIGLVQVFAQIRGVDFAQLHAQVDVAHVRDVHALRLHKRHVAGVARCGLSSVLDPALVVRLLVLVDVVAAVCGTEVVLVLAGLCKGQPDRALAP